MRTYLVTGGCGFIGSHIAAALVERGDSVRVLDNLCTGHLGNMAGFEDQVQFFEGDLCDASVLAKAVKGVDCIFHHAALASVPLSVEKPLEVNAACVTGTVNLLDQAQKAGVRRLVYAASSAAYGDNPKPIKDENDQLSTLSPYAAAKLAGEYYCQAFNLCFEIETVRLRYFNVFGPRQDPDSAYSAVIPLFITWMLADQQPTVFGDGLQSRDFTYVENVVQGNLLAADCDQAAGKVFNIANGRSVTLLDLITSLNEILDLDIKPSHEPPRVGDVRDSRADITSAKEVLGYDPKIEFHEGLERSIDYYRSLLDG